MPLQYFKKWVHTHHTDSIDCIAFSVDGVFLASGSMDGTVVICNAASGIALHIIHCRSGVLSLKWAPVRLHEVWCGLGDGRLLCVIIGETKIQTLCFRAHSYPIEHLAFDRSGLKLATGAQHELKVWRYLSQDRLRHVNDLSPPGAVSLTAREPTFVTSLHWLHSGDDAGCLLATYLYQGIICREPESGETRWAIPLRSLIGHADLSPDETRIAIFNQHNGVDIYKVPGAIWLKSYRFKIRDNVILPVHWIDEGLRIMAGSDSGTVCIWNVKNDAQLPPLLHGNCIVRALTAHYDLTTHTCRIATGTAEHGPRTSIHLFETKELREGGATRSLHARHKLSIPLIYTSVFLMAMIVISLQHYRVSGLSYWIQWDAEL